MSCTPKIGILSGVGPLAGSDVFAKVLRRAALVYGAVEDSEYPDTVLISHGIKGVDSKGTLGAAFEQEIVDMVKQLEKHGVTTLGIACNTAHIYLPKIAVKAGMHIVNLIDQVALEASRKPDRYLLLTSDVSKSQKLYHPYLKKYGVNFAETTRRQQRLLDRAIGMVMAYKLDQAGELLEQILLEARANGFDAVIAGCTELPMAIASCHNLHGVGVIDSNTVLAGSLTDAYYNQTAGVPNLLHLGK